MKVAKRLDNHESRISQLELDQMTMSEKLDLLIGVSGDQLNSIELRFVGFDQQFDRVDQQFDYMHKKFDRMDNRFDAVMAELERLSTEVAALSLN